MYWISKSTFLYKCLENLFKFMQDIKKRRFSVHLKNFRFNLTPLLPPPCKVLFYQYSLNHCYNSSLSSNFLFGFRY
jgi:hypothetical protein